MEIIKKYNGLAGTIVNRTELEALANEAYQEEQYHVYQRISNVLAENSDVQRFEIEALTPETETLKISGLAGVEYAGSEDFDDDDLQGLGRAVSSVEIYKMITDKMIERIKEVSSRDYEKTWQIKKVGFLKPLNFVSKKAYTGINHLLLNPIFNVLKNPYFLTAKQVEKNKGQIKKGAKSFKIVYFRMLFRTAPSVKPSFASYSLSEVMQYLTKNGYDATKDFVKIPILRYYNVFNGADVEGIDFKLDELGWKEGKLVPENSTENEAARLVIKHYPNPPKIFDINYDRAFYKPSNDSVSVPNHSFFKSVNDYYRTMFHELIHSTGHPKRFNRDFSGKFGSKKYAFEELVAEFGAVFLSAQAGILWHTNKNHAAYLKGWNSILTYVADDAKFFMKAASKAQQAADHVLNLNKNGEPAFWQEFLEKETSVKAKEPSTKAKETKPKAPKPKAPKPKTPKEPKTTQNTLFDGLGMPTAQDPDTIAFNKEILKAKREGVEPNKIFSLGKTKGILKKHIGEHNLSVSGAVLMKAMEKDSDHIAVFEHFINMPDYINNPVAIFKSKTFPKTGKVILTEIKTYKEKPLMVAIHVNKSYKVSKIASIYNRKNNTTYKNWIEEDLAIYINKKSLNELLPGTIPISHTTKGQNKNTTKPANRQTKKQKNNPKGLSASDVTAHNTLFDGLGMPTAQEPDAIAFNKEILKAKREGISDNASLDLGFAKGKLLKIIGRKKIVLKGRTIKKAMTKDDSHIMLWNNFINLPDYLNNPLAVFKSKSTGYVILTEITNYKEKPIIAAIHLNQKLYVSEIKSMYSRKNDSTYTNWVKDGELIYGNKKSDLFLRVFKRYNSASGNKSQDKTTTKPANRQTKTQKNNPKGLSAPEFSEIPVVAAPLEIPPPPLPEKPLNKNSLAYRMESQPMDFESFTISDEAMSAFLGDVEKKPFDSLVVTITGKQGSGKTRFAFQFINALAQNYKVAHASMEEHPQSRLYMEKVQQYFNDTTLANTEAHDVRTLEELDTLIKRNDVIVIDSFQKMKDLHKPFEVDRDLRKKYNGKLFLVIYQQTVTGQMRGGSKSQFDGDIILFTESFPDYKENYVYPDKNRYNREVGLKYSIYNQNLLTEPEETNVIEVY